MIWCNTQDLCCNTRSISPLLHFCSKYHRSEEQNDIPLRFKWITSVPTRQPKHISRVVEWDKERCRNQRLVLVPLENNEMPKSSTMLQRRFQSWIPLGASQTHSVSGLRQSRRECRCVCWERVALGDVTGNTLARGWCWSCKYFAIFYKTKICFGVLSKKNR